MLACIDSRYSYLNIYLDSWIWNTSISAPIVSNNVVLLSGEEAHWQSRSRTGTPVCVWLWLGVASGFGWGIHM